MLLVALTRASIWARNSPELLGQASMRPAGPESTAPGRCRRHPTAPVRVQVGDVGQVRAPVLVVGPQPQQIGVDGSGGVVVDQLVAVLGQHPEIRGWPVIGRTVGGSFGR